MNDSNNYVIVSSISKAGIVDAWYNFVESFNEYVKKGYEPFSDIQVKEFSDPIFFVAFQILKATDSRQ